MVYYIQHHVFQVVEVLGKLDFQDINEVDLGIEPKDPLVVFMDGIVLGYVSAMAAPGAEQKLRDLKFSGLIGLKMMEVCLIPNEGEKQINPGLFVFTENCRPMRPVTSFRHDASEYIGSYEQDRLQIACLTKGEDRKTAKRCGATHQELRPDAILDTVAACTPFSDHNHGCRNLYQIQMAKQTMATPGYTSLRRCDGKSFQLETPQTPLVRTVMYDKAEIDRYPFGTNAIVAVMAYTGYDMEDAMVINKSSWERGFAFGHCLKTFSLNLKADWVKATRPRENEVCPHSFLRDPTRLAELEDSVGPDGLPYVGKFYAQGDMICCKFDAETGKYKDVKNSYATGYVAAVRAVGVDQKGPLGAGLKHVVLLMWCSRRPEPGDKFASRHGQKGILSYQYPQADLPFTDSGMTPDIIFNPHGFPSRMTVGKLIEGMAGKFAAVDGRPRVEAGPFTYSDKKPAIRYFGEKLMEVGYNYYGQETMYCGLTGNVMVADIFFGMIYYQRLRHLIEDKVHCRSTGSVDPATYQPVEGRSQGGGIRFGEMERDSLIAYGAAFLLKDR